ETAAMADRQQQVSEALHRGEAGAPTRSQQASVEEGTDVVAGHIREAAGKHALGSPQLDAALGYAKRQMAAARGQLEEADPNASAAAALAAAGPLAQEARELARQLEAGRLDQRTIERQQRLYHRLLDAGRSLSNDEPDQNKERQSRAATGDSVHVPAALKPGATGAGPRIR